jgi:replicative DNA helicase
MVNSNNKLLDTGDPAVLYRQDVEWAILAELFWDWRKTQPLLIQAGVTPAYFYGTVQREVYIALTSIISKNPSSEKMLDIAELTWEVNKNAEGDSHTPAISENLINAYARGSEYFLKKHIELLCKYAEKRAVIHRISNLLNSLLNNKEAGDALTDAQVVLFDFLSKGEQHLKRLNRQKSSLLVQHTLTYLESVCNRNKDRRIYRTGIEVLDSVLTFRPGELFIIAAEPGTGKTAFLTQYAAYLAAQNIPTLLLSLEMDSPALAHRILANMGGLNHTRLNSLYMSEYEWALVDATIERQKKMPIYLETYNQINVETLTTLIRTYVQNKKIEVVFIDYLQLLAQASKASRPYEALIEIVTVLRQLALDLGIGIVLASQLTRPDNNVRKVNGISHLELHNLAGGVATGQNAHIVITLQTSKEAYPDCPFAEDLVYVSILKNRNGRSTFKKGTQVMESGKAVLVFVAAQMKFVTLDSSVPLSLYSQDEE